jgi:hypothetical protein
LRELRSPAGHWAHYRNCLDAEARQARRKTALARPRR